MTELFNLWLAGWMDGLIEEGRNDRKKERKKALIVAKNTRGSSDLVDGLQIINI